MQNFDNMEPAVLLAEVNSAIKAVLTGGQSYRIGSRQLTRANITELRNLKSELEAQIVHGSSPGLLNRTFVAVFDGR